MSENFLFLITTFENNSGQITLIWAHPSHHYNGIIIMVIMSIMTNLKNVMEHLWGVLQSAQQTPLWFKEPSSVSLGGRQGLTFS